MSSPQFKVTAGISGGVIIVGNTAFLKRLIKLTEDAAQQNPPEHLERALTAALNQLVPPPRPKPRK